MKLENLKNVIEDNYTDEEKIIRVQGVRDGKEYVLYEAWSSDDELVLSVAEKGSRDYDTIMDSYNKEQAQKFFKEKVSQIESIGYKIWDLVDHDDPIHDKVDVIVREIEQETDYITYMDDAIKVLDDNADSIKFVRDALDNIG